MTDKPIIFSAPMVRALLDGRKTQTRRVLKPQPSAEHCLSSVGGDGGSAVFRNAQNRYRQDVPFCYAVDDRLWVREQWSGPHVWREMLPRDRQRCGAPTATQVWHWADGDPEHGDWERPRPSIHMPRWASRITLLVTDVRVQRVQDISEADAIAEGLARVTKDGSLWKFGLPDRDGLPGRDNTGWAWVDWEVNPRAAFRRLWNSIHGPDAWDRNDWVAAYSFERLPA